MRTTVTIDDELLEAAREYASAKDTAGVIREALTSFVQLQASRRLAAMGGTEPDLDYIPRRRFPAE